jgi:hypothetical protein
VFSRYGETNRKACLSRVVATEEQRGLCLGFVEGALLLCDDLEDAVNVKMGQPTRCIMEIAYRDCSSGSFRFGVALPDDGPAFARAPALS